MILRGVRNQTVEIKVLGESLDLTDSDWVKVHLKVKSEVGDWEVVDESFMVSEFIELIGWFKDLSQNKDVEYKDLYFTEPNLEFSVIGSKNDQKKIKMIFSAESRPKSAKESEVIFVDFDLSNNDLSNIASGLESEFYSKVNGIKGK